MTLLAGCQYLPFGYVSIGDIKRNLAAFEMKVIKIKGDVTDANKLPFVDVRMYQLTDATGSIMVVTQDGLPEVGNKIAIQGRVENMMILAGQGIGYIVKEVERLPTL